MEANWIIHYILYTETHSILLKTTVESEQVVRMVAFLWRIQVYL